MTNTRTVSHCSFCGSEDSSGLYKDNRHLVVCGNCGLVYSKQQLSVDGMRSFYNKDYFASDNSAQKGYEHYFGSGDNIRKTFSRRMDLIERYSGAPGKVLDIGCAAGFFLEIARKRGWDVRGIDISEVCADYARDRLGIKVINELFLNVEFGGELFDLITMWDYLEHSISPKEDIMKARGLLRKGGLFVLATPDITSVPARVFKSNWIGIKLEEHFYYFSRDMLSKFISGIGFDILRVSYAGKYVSSGILADRLIFYNKFLFHLLRKALKSLRFSFYCNPFDIMLIIGRKK